MKRAFWHPILALLVGAVLRAFFVLKYPGNSGDTIIYDQLAANWLAYGKYAMNVAGQPLSVDIRMPGYPMYLALVAFLTRQTPENAHQAAMVGQILIDLAACLAIAALAATLTRLWAPEPSPPNAPAERRVFLAALWLAVLCPFTANYVAVPLTETWAIFFTAVATLALVPLLRAVHGPWLFPDERWRKNGWNIFLAGFLAGLGTLFRPETPLLLFTVLVVLAYFLWRARKFWRFVKVSLLLLCGAAVPLAPWAIRNAVTLQEIQPLTPKDANLPGELVPKGFMAWESTWLYRVRDNYLVPWKLNDEQINVDDIPASAFDTPEEGERIAAALEAYNLDLTLSPEEDAVFAQVARERTARYPLRTYL